MGVCDSAHNNRGNIHTNALAYGLFNNPNTNIAPNNAESNNNQQETSGNMANTHHSSGLNNNVNNAPNLKTDNVIQVIQHEVKNKEPLGYYI